VPEQPLIPRAVLFGNPERTAPVTSPAGTRLGFVAPVDGVLNAWVGPVDDPDAARPVTHARGHGVRSLLFGHDDRTLVYLQDTDGDENWRIHTLDLAIGRSALRLKFAHRPELSEHVLAPMEPFTVAARDGLPVHGYLAVPLGVARDRLPAVVMVHGGPCARDGRLLRRVVRGLRGAGRSGLHSRAVPVRRGPGRTVQPADPARLGAGPLAAPAGVHARQGGDPDREAAMLWERPPLSAVDRTTAAVLVAHGATDPPVRQAESEQIVAALRERGVPHVYLLFPDEGHGLARPENRDVFYARAEAFLARHLGGRTQP